MLWKIWEKPAAVGAGENDSWYVALQDQFFAAVKEAEADGTLGRGGVLKRFGLTPDGAIILDSTYREMAERQAAARSMTTPDYISMRVHYALLSREP